MRSTAAATATAAGIAAKAIFDAARRILAFLSLAAARARQRRALAELDEHLLRDIGRSPQDAAREAAKPGWRA